MLWINIGVLIITPALIAFRTVIIAEILKKHEIDLADSMLVSLMAGVIVFIISLFFMRLIFL
jgi:hypothetical protein